MKPTTWSTRVMEIVGILVSALIVVWSVAHVVPATVHSPAGLRDVAFGWLVVTALIVLLGPSIRRALDAKRGPAGAGATRSRDSGVDGTALRQTDSSI